MTSEPFAYIELTDWDDTHPRTRPAHGIGADSSHHAVPPTHDEGDIPLINDAREPNQVTNVSSDTELERSRTLLQRLASLKPARLDPRRDRYSTLSDPDDIYNVDLSSLEGPGSYFQNPLQEEPGKTQDSHSRTNINLKLDPGTDQMTRSVTIRKHGQRLAQDTNMIVSVKEVSPTVDLTSLEGRRPSSVSTSPKPTDLADLSYFYPVDPEQPNWKPLPMRSPYIIMLAIVSLGLAGVQEYLCQKSQSLERLDGGLIQYNLLSNIPVALFFCWKYLPTIVMVSYGVFWQVTDYEIQRLEPYYQLSRPRGNTASKSLNLDYVTLWAYFVPVKAIKNRHWAVLISSIGTILATTVAPSLQNPSIMAVRNPKCKDGLSDCEADFKYFLRIHPVWSRLATACLIIVAITAVILLFQLRRKSGLLSDPRGVAGIASMATKSHILTDFHGMDESLHDEIHQKLRHRRYILYKSTIWQGEYIKQTDPAVADTKKENPHPIILRQATLLTFIVFLIICLPFIPAISYTRLNEVTHKLPWLPILLATLIKQLWATLEFALKMMEPFYTLTRGNARPDQTLTLDYQGVPYGILPCKALVNRHYLVSMIGFGSILGDMLTVTLSSLSMKTETENSFYTSSILSIAILSILITSAITVFFLRRKPFMPRQPSTIASVLAFVHQSKMLDDFVDTEQYTHSQMEEMLLDAGKRYGLGWFRGRDGRPHCAIDQEPMLSRYVHGVSYIRAQAPWEENV